MQPTTTDPFETSSIHDKTSLDLESLTGNDVYIGELQDKTQWITIMGVRFPYIPSERVTVINTDGSRAVRDIQPGYITHFKSFEEKGTPSSLETGLLSAQREILLSLVREMSLSIKGYDAPIAVSAAVPKDHVFFDRHRIYLNEAQAENRYVDADGDRGTLLFSKDRQLAVLVKFPITSQPLVLNVIERLQFERFEDFGQDECDTLKAQYPMKTFAEPSPDMTPAEKDDWGQLHWDRMNLRLKAHRDVPVGLLTNAHNSWDLWQSRNMSFEEKLKFLFNDPQRAIDIEDFGMKSVRKDNRESGEANVLRFGASKALAHHHAWGLTSASQIGNMRPNQVNWVLHSDLGKVVKDIRALNVQFRDINPTTITEKAPHMIDGGLINRLMRMGLLRTIEYPHFDSNMPPAVMIYLSLPNGMPVALTDVKRDNNRQEGLTWAFLMAPIYDNLDIYDAEGNIVIPASNKFVHPLNHMAKVLSTFDSRIINPSLDASDPNYVVGYFPLNDSHEDFREPKRAIKVAMLQKAIAEYAGIYGDSAPAIYKDHKLQLTGEGYGTIIRTVMIDFGRSMTEFEMSDVIDKALQQCKFCDIGSKSTSRRRRKYMLANSVGGSILAPKTVHPARAAKSRAQLQRALHSATYRVAIVKSDTLKQIFITPSGIKKQATTQAFLPQVLNTLEDYENYLKGHGKTEEESPAKTITYLTWTGEKRMCWVIDAKSSIEIGKLIDVIGNKFMPRPIGQVYETGNLVMVPDKGVFPENGEEIDLLMPYFEIVDKYVHLEFLKGAVEKEIRIGKTIVKAMVVERTFNRTGSASENIPPRVRRCNYRGIDMFPIFAALTQIRDIEMKPINMGFATALQLACQQLLGSNGQPTVRDTEFENLINQQSYKAQAPF